MRFLLVVNNPTNWPLQIPGVEIVAARAYLTDPNYNKLRGVRVLNLCRSYAYQTLGYYVSLLAEARGHKPRPDIVTIQDMKSPVLSRVITEELDHLIQTTLRPIKSERFELSIYFGRTLTKRDRTLGRRLFNLFPSPMLRAQFVYREGKWTWQGIRAIGFDEVPDTHRSTVLESATKYFTHKSWSGRAGRKARYFMAILHDPAEDSPPSDEVALDKFIRSAARHDIAAELITRDDYGSIAEYDALFIRTTTAVDHYTFRFARRAEAAGLAVIDDPASIARCANKVFLAERLTLKGIPTPPTGIIHKDNVDAVLEQIGLPIVLKQPDSAFSMGVTKAETVDEYREKVAALLADSDLVVAQGFMPTDFDWRVGVLDGKPLHVCQYHMAKKHWQIVDHASGGRYGSVKAVRLEDAPKRVVSVAVRAAKLMGDGLYGVDVKQVGSRAVVIEVNDNPNLEAGYEDRVLKSELYDRVMQSFLRRIEHLRNGGDRRGR
ncbi:MAG: ATP-grasp domain-containing protein [Phycisphaera sp.]|nr:ATP-grasp domain-containing protein [Phycisphaera sp.]